MQVRWTPTAAEDLKAIVSHIRKDNPSVARSVAEKLFSAANSLDQYPLKGRQGKISGTRELVVSGLPYIVVYRVAGDAVHIAHIYHGARDWSP